MEPTAEVSTLADYEIELTFPAGPVGILLEPVVRVGNRKVGARIAGFSPSSDQDFFVKGRTSSPFPLSPSTSLGDLAAEHLCVGHVLTRVDDICTKVTSFDRIMALLHEKSNQTRKLRFKDVEAAWINSSTRGSPSVERKIISKAQADSPFTAFSKSEHARASLSPPRMAPNGFHLHVTRHDEEHRVVSSDDGETTTYSVTHYVGDAVLVTQPGALRPSSDSSSQVLGLDAGVTLSSAPSSASAASVAYASSLLSEALEGVEEGDEEEDASDEEEEECDVSLVPRAAEESASSLDESSVGGETVEAAEDSGAQGPRTPSAHDQWRRLRSTTTTASSPAIVSLEAFLASPADSNPFQRDRSLSSMSPATGAGGREEDDGNDVASPPLPPRPDFSLDAASAHSTPESAVSGRIPLLDDDGSMHSVDLNRGETPDHHRHSPRQRVPLQEIPLPRNDEVTSSNGRQSQPHAETSSDSSIAEEGTACEIVDDPSFTTSLPHPRHRGESSAGCSGGSGGRSEVSPDPDLEPRAAALEEMVSNLMQQKLSWAETTASLEAQLKAEAARTQALEHELASKDDTLSLMASQAENDAITIQSLEEKIASLELLLQSGEGTRAESADASSEFALAALSQTVGEQSEALDRLHASAAARQREVEALEDQVSELQAQLARANAAAKLEAQRLGGKIANAQRLGRREKEVSTSLRRQLDRLVTAKEGSDAEVAELREKLQILMQGALATATSIADCGSSNQSGGGASSSSPVGSLGGYTPLLKNTTRTVSTTPTSGGSSSGSPKQQLPVLASSRQPTREAAHTNNDAGSAPAAAREAFNTGAYLEGLVDEAEQEQLRAAEQQGSLGVELAVGVNGHVSGESDEDEEDAEVSAGDEPYTSPPALPSTLPASSPAQPVVLAQSPPGSPSAAVTALQEVVSKLMEEKLSWLDEREHLRRELSEQEAAIQAMASDARGEEGSLEEAQAEVERLGAALSDAELRVAEAEAQVSLSLRRAESAAAARAQEKAEEHAQEVKAVRVELESKVEELARELSEMRSAVLEMTQVDDDDDAAEEVGEEERDGEIGGLPSESTTAMKVPSEEKEAVEMESGVAASASVESPCFVPTVSAAQFLANSSSQSGGSPSAAEEGVLEAGEAHSPELNVRVDGEAPLNFSSPTWDTAVSTPTKKPLQPTPHTAALLRLCERIDSNSVLPQWESPTPTTASTSSKQQPSPLTHGSKLQTSSAIRRFKQQQQQQQEHHRDLRSPAKHAEDAALITNMTPVKAAIAAWKQRHVSASSSSSSVGTGGAPPPATPAALKYLLSQAASPTAAQTLQTPQKSKSFGMPRTPMSAGAAWGGRGRRDWRAEAQAASRRLAEAREELLEGARRREDLATQVQASVREAETFARLRADAVAEVEGLKRRASASDARVASMDQELSSLRDQLLRLGFQQQQQVNDDDAPSVSSSAASPVDEENMDPLQHSAAYAPLTPEEEPSGDAAEAPLASASPEATAASPVGFGNAWPRGLVNNNQGNAGESHDGESSWLEMQGYPLPNQDASFVSLAEDSGGSELLEQSQDANECSVVSDITSSSYAPGAEGGRGEAEAWGQRQQRGAVPLAVTTSRYITKGSTKPPAAGAAQPHTPSSSERRRLEREIRRLRTHLHSARVSLEKQRQATAEARAEARVSAQMSARAHQTSRHSDEEKHRSQRLDERAVRASEAAAAAAQAAQAAAEAASAVAAQRTMAAEATAAMAEVDAARQAKQALEGSQAGAAAALAQARAEAAGLRSEVSALTSGAKKAVAQRDVLRSELAKARSEAKAAAAQQAADHEAKSEGRASRIAAKKKQWLREVGQARRSTTAAEESGGDADTRVEEPRPERKNTAAAQSAKAKAMESMLRAAQPPPPHVVVVLRPLEPSAGAEEPAPLPNPPPSVMEAEKRPSADGGVVEPGSRVPKSESDAAGLEASASYEAARVEVEGLKRLVEDAEAAHFEALQDMSSIIDEKEEEEGESDAENARGVADGAEAEKSARWSRAVLDASSCSGGFGSAANASAVALRLVKAEADLEALRSDLAEATAAKVMSEARVEAAAAEFVAREELLEAALSESKAEAALAKAQAEGAHAAGVSSAEEKAKRALDAERAALSAAYEERVRAAEEKALAAQRAAQDADQQVARAQQAAEKAAANADAAEACLKRELERTAQEAAASAAHAADQRVALLDHAGSLQETVEQLEAKLASSEGALAAAAAEQHHQGSARADEERDALQRRVDALEAAVDEAADVAAATVAQDRAALEARGKAMAGHLADLAKQLEVSAQANRDASGLVAQSQEETRRAQEDAVAAELQAQYAQEEVETLAARLSAAEASQEQASAEVSQARDRVCRLAAELDEARAAAEEAEEKAETEKAALRSWVEDLEQSITALTKQIEDATAGAATAGAGAEETVSDLRGDLQGALEAKAEAEAALGEASAEAARLAQACAGLEVQLEESVKALAEEQRKNAEDAHGQMVQLNRELGLAKERRDAAEEAAARSTSELASVHSQVQELERALASATAALAQEQGQAAGSGALLQGEVSRLKAELAAAALSTTSLEEDATSAARERDVLSERLQELEGSAAQMAQQLAASEAAAAHASRQSNADADTLRMEMSSAVAAKEEAEQWLQDCRAKLVATQTDLEERNRTAAQYAAETLAQRAELVEQVGRLEHALGESQGRVAQVSHELSASAKAASDALIECQASQQALALAEAAADQERAAHEEAMQAHLAASAAAAALRQEEEEARLEQAATANATALQQERDRCAERLAAKEAELQQLSAECAQGEAGLEAAVARAREAEEALAQVEAQVEEQKQAFAQGLSEAQEHAREATAAAVEEATKGLSTAEATKAEACAAAAAAATEQAWAAAEVAAQEMAEAAEAEANVQAAQARSAYEDSLKQLQEKLSEATLSATAGEMAAASFAKERETLTAKAASLEQDVAKYTADLAAAQASLEDRSAKAALAEAFLDKAVAELEGARQAEARAQERAEQAEADKASLRESVRRLEEQVVELGEAAKAGAKQAAEEQLEVAAAARALEKVASDARLAAAQEEVTSLQALLEESEEKERSLAQELGEREQELAALEARCVEVENELTGMEADLDSVAMRAAAAEGELDLATHRLQVEQGRRKQSEALASERLEQLEDLRLALEDATEEGRDREAQALASKRRLSLDLATALASATATLGVCAARERVAEVRAGRLEQQQGGLSRLVAHAESVAVGSVGKLQQQLEELRAQVASRDVRVGKLRESLRESQDATRSAEAGLARAVEQHALKVAGLEGALRAAAQRESENAHELSLLRAAVHGGLPQDPLLLSPSSGDSEATSSSSSSVLSLVGLTPGRASKARVAYLERLRADIAKLRTENQRLRMQQAHQGKTPTPVEGEGGGFLATTPSPFNPLLKPVHENEHSQQQESSGASSSLHGDLAMEAPAPVASNTTQPSETGASTTRRSTSRGRSVSMTREASATLRAQNRTLHDHVQRSRRALSVIASAKAKLKPNPAPVVTAPRSSSAATNQHSARLQVESSGNIPVDAKAPATSGTSRQNFSTVSVPTETLDIKLAAVAHAVSNAVDKENSGVVVARAAANGVSQSPSVSQGTKGAPSEGAPQNRVTPTRMQARLAEKRLSLSASAKKQRQGSSSKAQRRGTSAANGGSGLSVWVDGTNTETTSSDIPEAHGTPRRKGALTKLRSFASPKATTSRGLSATPRSSQRTPLASRKNSTAV